MEKQQDHYLQGVTASDRENILRSLTQPVTATQLSRKLSLSLDRCSSALLSLQSKKLVKCLNPRATRSRLFWLTRAGKDYQRLLTEEVHISYDIPSIDWELYATICYSHRSEVIRSLTHAMQPATLRRRAAFRKPGLRMSANNVRDVIRYLNIHGIVRPVPLKKKAHPGYELTERGKHMQRLLLRAEVRL